MLSKMKTKQVQNTQLVAICVEMEEGLVCVCVHTSHMQYAFFFTEYLWENIQEPGNTDRFW